VCVYVVFLITEPLPWCLLIPSAYARICVVCVSVRICVLHELLSDYKTR